jgi:hypothetical protein
VTISNPDSLSSSEEGVHIACSNKKLKKPSCEIDVRKPLVIYISRESEDLRLYNLGI